MSEIAELLERKRRGVHAPAGSFERLIRLRDRKARNRRIASAALALTLASGAVAVAVRAFEAGDRPIPAAPITEDNVSQLAPAWSADLGSAAASQTNVVAAPVVADGSVYVATADGRVEAFDEGCGSGGTTCRPRWTADLGNAITYAPTAGDGSVFVTTKDGRLFEFPADCSASCTASWVGELGGPASSSAVVSGGLVYVSDFKVLYAFPVDCEVVNLSCEPVWQRLLGGGSLASRPFVAKTSVYAPVVAGAEVLQISADHHLYAFDAATGDPRWVGAPKTPLKIRYLTRYDSPVVAGDEVFASLARGLYAFPLGCRTDGATCRPDWWTRISADQAYVGQPVVGDGLVFVGSGQPGSNGEIWVFRPDGRRSDVATEPGDFSSVPLLTQYGMLYAPTLDEDRIYGFATNGHARLAPRWSAEVVRPEGSTAVGALVFATSDDGTIQAFTPGCQRQVPDRTCSPAWTGHIFEGYNSAPVEADGRIFVLGKDGTLRAFAVRAEAPAPGATHSSRSSTGLFYLGAVLALLAIVLVGRLRGRRAL